jgi:GT2 family glycosyltransferase
MGFNERKDAEMAWLVKKPFGNRMLLGRPSARWCGRPGETGAGWGYESCWFSQDITAAHLYTNGEIYDTPMIKAYQQCFEVARNNSYEIIGMIHDDVSIYEPGWDLRVLAEFDDSEVGAVGFFGATSHCQPQLYSEPCKPVNFTRSGVISNMRREACSVGERYTGSCDVAVFDGLALFIRTSLLQQIGGWPQDETCRYFGYDYFISMEARRLGYRLRVVGIDCDHWSGKGMPVANELAMEEGKLNPCGDEAHRISHQILYDRYKGTGVIPYTVQDQRRKP